MSGVLARASEGQLLLLLGVTPVQIARLWEPVPACQRRGEVVGQSHALSVSLALVDLVLLDRQPEGELTTNTLGLRPRALAGPWCGHGSVLPSS